MDNYEKNLNTSIYEHFYTFYKRKSVCLITNKQLLFFSYRNNVLDTHYNILKMLNKNAFDVDNDEMLLNIGSHVAIVTSGPVMQIILPHRKYLTVQEYNLLKYYLEEVKLVEDFAKFNITISGLSRDIFTTNELDNAIEYIKSLEVEETPSRPSTENIVGKTYDYIIADKQKRYIRN